LQGRARGSLRSLRATRRRAPAVIK